ncbi:MAG: PAS/PAC sensor signal transduction histidine kinase [Promethearchaeota archaeon CR_4]|nr:MAG: PAS/PAC sensor signal transduction histidine kinase [Candidatus Lokiarchaeota archaeon CR_4]
MIQIAHELKTPLTSILGWAELLYNAKKQGDNLDAFFKLEDLLSIFRNAERLNILISEFLDMGRFEHGMFEIVKVQANFSNILENALKAVDNLAAEKAIRITIDAVPFVNLCVDRRRMEQVIIHLLTNAIKYSPEKTRVTIKANIEEHNAHKMLRVRVIDEGYGFEIEELSNATTPFAKAYTRQQQKRVVLGSGLGLYISRGIIEQHGGTLEIRSDGANCGTQIEIFLPID